MKRPPQPGSIPSLVWGMFHIRTRVTFQQNLRNRVDLHSELSVDYPTCSALRCTTYRRPAKKSLRPARLWAKTHSCFLVPTRPKLPSNPSPWLTSKSFILPRTGLLTRSFQSVQAWSWAWTRLRFNADLVTLSACNTGVGKIEGEEGVTNLVEAFLVSGAKAVVASLWSADDTYTGALMERFYTHVAEGQEKAVALRHAKLDLLARDGGRVPPYYWGAFVLVGEGGTAIPLGER